jgi:hypothetical protein
MKNMNLATDSIKFTFPELGNSTGGEHICLPDEVCQDLTYSEFFKDFLTE